MQEEYKNYIIFISNPLVIKDDGFVVRYQISLKNGKPLNSFDLELKNIKTKEVSKELALVDAKKYIDENL